MEKIKLSNGQTFDLVPMGISSADKHRSFVFTSDLSYAEIEASFKDTANIATIQYISADNEAYSTYADGVKMTELSKNYDTGNYTVVISTDAVQQQIKELITQIKVWKDKDTATVSTPVTETTTETGSNTGSENLTE